MATCSTATGTCDLPDLLVNTVRDEGRGRSWAGKSSGFHLALGRFESWMLLFSTQFPHTPSLSFQKHSPFLPTPSFLPQRRAESLPGARYPARFWGPGRPGSLPYEAPRHIGETRRHAGPMPPHTPAHFDTPGKGGHGVGPPQVVREGFSR